MSENIQIDSSQICVSIQPEEARDYIKWKIVNSDGDASVWFTSGQNISVPFGEHTIIGETVAGWTIEENNIIVIVEENEIILLDLKYIQHGNLKVKIQTDEAKTLARWEISDTNIWFSDGDEIDLAPGSYEIAFNSVDNFVKPTNTNISIEENEITTLTAQYVPYGILQVNITLPTTVSEIPTWRIRNNTDTTWKTSGYYIYLEAGTYLIEFNSVNNIYTHSDVEVIIESDVLKETDILYEGLQLLVVPNYNSLFCFNYNNFNRLDLFDSTLTDINQVVFNQSVTILAIVSNNSPFLILYDCINFSFLNIIIEKPISGCRSVCFSNEDDYLVISHNTYPFLTVYETTTWSKIDINELPTSYCNALIFDNNDQKLITGYNKSPYLSAYSITENISGSTLSIIELPSTTMSEVEELGSVLCAKYNNSDLIIGFEKGIRIYDNNFYAKTISYLNVNTVESPIYGIEIVNNIIVAISSLYLYIYQFNGSSYQEEQVTLPIKSNVNTHIKTDSTGNYLLISNLRSPGLLIYKTSDWSLVDYDIDMLYSKKFDISNDLSSRTYIVTPVNEEPIDGKRGLYTGQSLTASEFDYYNSSEYETHTASQWRIISNSTGEIVEETIVELEDVSSVDDLITYELDSIYFTDVKSYNWQVRYEGSESGWSFWSEATTFITSYSYIEKPINNAPANDEEDVIENVELISSAFNSVNLTDTHIKSQWKVFKNVENSLEQVYYSGSVDDLTRHIIPLGLLLAKEDDDNPEYIWTVRHQGNLIGWSEWSEETSFKTGLWGVNQPTNVTPTDLSIDINGDVLTLISDEFSVNGLVNTQVAARWEIYDSEDLLIYRSGEVSIDYTGEISYPIRRNIVENGENTYSWRVAYKGNSYGWSEWSELTSFTTKALVDATVKINITPNEILPGRTELLKWRWREITSETFSDYQEPTTDVLITSEQTIYIEFESYSGYATPSPITLYLQPGQLYEFSVLYQPVSGSIKITLTPSEGLWKIQGLTGWKTSGSTQNNLPYDDYTITYCNIINYETPVTEIISINSTTEDVTVNRNYTISDEQYSLKVVCDPSTAYWKLDSEDIWYVSGQAISLFGIESDMIVFQDIYQKVTPSNISFTIPDDYAIYPDLAVTRQLLYNVSYQSINACNLTVNLNVGRWKVVGGSSWINSGISTELTAGSYEITFEDISNYVKPFNKVITITAGENKSFSINYTEIGNNTIKINISPREVWNYTQYRSKYSIDNGDTWNEWSEWIPYYYDGDTFNNVIYAPITGLYKIEVKSINNNFEAETTVKNVDYEDGIYEINFNFNEVVSDVNRIDVKISPSKVIGTAKYRYRFKLSEDVDFGEWSEWE